MRDESSLHLEPIERLAMDVIRNPGASKTERAAAIAVLRELLTRLPAHEKRITDLLVLIRERLQEEADVVGLVRVLRAMPMDDAARTRALVRVAKRAWDEGALETWKWLVESGFIPEENLEPAWLPSKTHVELPARFALVFCGPSSDTRLWVEKTTRRWVTDYASTQDPESLQRAARADLAFVLVDMRSAESRALARRTTETVSNRGALVVGIACHADNEGLASALQRGERGALGHTFFTVDANKEISSDGLVVPLRDEERISMQHTEIVETIAAPLLGTSGVSIDFTRLRKLLRDGGHAKLGIGEAEGVGRASLAAERAMDAADVHAHQVGRGSHILFHITASKRTTVEEVDEIAACIRDRLGQPASIVWTSGISEYLADSRRVAMLVTRTNTPSS